MFHTAWEGISEGYKGVNWQPSKGLNIYRQPIFRDVLTVKSKTLHVRSLVKWQTDSRPSSEKSILAKTKKLGPTSSDDRVYAVSIAKMDTTKFTAYFTKKPLFYWYWQKGLNFSDNWQSHNPLVAFISGGMILTPLYAPAQCV